MAQRSIIACSGSIYSWKIPFDSSKSRNSEFIWSTEGEISPSQHELVWSPKSI